MPSLHQPQTNKQTNKQTKHSNYSFPGVYASLDDAAQAPRASPEPSRAQTDLSGPYRRGAAMQSALDSSAPPVSGGSEPSGMRRRSELGPAQRRGSGVYYSIDDDASAPAASAPSMLAKTIHTDAQWRGAGVYACLDGTLPIPEPSSSVARAGNMDTLAEFAALRSMGGSASSRSHHGSSSSHPADISATVAASIAQSVLVER